MIIMIQTRGSEKTKPVHQPKKKLKDYKKPTKPYDILQSMMECFSETNSNPEILIPLSDKIEMSEEELQNKSFILMGPGHSGKNSTVKWLMRENEKDVIELDCKIWQTDTSFLNQLLNELGIILKRKLPKDLVIPGGGINCKELSKVIKD